jgi:energy-coupling factor transporter ATP-binding protein EcfA2
MQQRQVTITDIGPITDFSFAVPEEGGVVVLRGRMGAGKTTALEALNVLAGRPADVAHRDGAAAGQVNGFGATLKVGRRATRAGELEVASLEGRFSVLDLVDPKIKEPGAADAKRIKALVQLAGGAGADPSLFYKLLGSQEELQKYVSPKTLATDDLVTLAARIKRDLEEKARHYKEEAERESIAAESDRQATVGVNMYALDNEAGLAADYEFSLQEESILKTQARAALDAQYRAEEAGKALAEVEKTYTGIGVALAEVNLDMASQEEIDCAVLVRDAEAALARAQAQHLEAKQKQEIASEALRSAHAHENTIAKWRETLAAKLPPLVTDEQLAAAAADVKSAKDAMLLGQTVRDAKQRYARANEHAEKAADYRTKEDRLRIAAQGTDDVLSGVVARLGCPLSVSHGRLVTPTKRSDTELFSDLSRGQQWTLVIQIAIKAVGRGGLLVIDQEGWEGIDPEHKELIANLLKGSGVVLITAHCDVGELRAETVQAA